MSKEQLLAVSWVHPGHGRVRVVAFDDALAAIEELQRQLNELQLQYIEATNPGIDMDAVKEKRSERRDTSGS